MQLRDVGSLGRVLMRQAGMPVLLLLLLVLYARGGPAVPALGGGGWSGTSESRSLPLPSATLHYLLGEGLPTLGNMRPPAGPFGLGSQEIAALGAYAVLGVLPHDPRSLFQSAFAGFAFKNRTQGAAAPSLAQWLQRLPQSSVRTPPRQIGGDLRIYGSGTPLVGLYATEGLAAYVGRPASPSAPPPTAQDPSRDVLGVVAALGQALGADGVPTIASLQANDSEGELGVYLKSYAVARSILKAEPQLAIVLDVERPTFPSLPATVLRSGRRVAGVALVVGTGENLPQPDAAQNLALAKSLGSYLQGRLPGVFLGVVRSPDRLNQQLSPTMLRIDIGGPQATPAEVRQAIPGIAQAIADFLGGAPLP